MFSYEIGSACDLRQCILQSKITEQKWQGQGTEGDLAGSTKVEACGSVDRCHFSLLPAALGILLRASKYLLPNLRSDRLMLAE